MKRQVKIVLLRLLIALGAHKLTRALTKHKAIILAYHGFISDEQLTPEENYEGRHLEIGKFKRQLEYLQRYHHVVSIESLVAHCRDGAPLPEHAVAITIDDGYASFSQLALPILKQLNLPAAIFLPTEFLDQQNMLWVDRLEYAASQTDAEKLMVSVGDQHHSFRPVSNGKHEDSLAHLRVIAKQAKNSSRLKMIEELEQQAGVSLDGGSRVPPHLLPLQWDQVADMVSTELVSVGSHSVSHPILSNCSAEEVQHELEASKRSIEQHVGRPCEVFCYPNGGPADLNHTTRRLLQETGYTSALSTMTGGNDPSTDVYELKRHMIDNRANWPDFVARTSGLMDYLLRIKDGVFKLHPKMS